MTAIAARTAAGFYRRRPNPLIQPRCDGAVISAVDETRAEEIARETFGRRGVDRPHAGEAREERQRALELRERDRSSRLIEVGQPLGLLRRGGVDCRRADTHALQREHEDGIRGEAPDSRDHSSTPPSPGARLPRHSKPARLRKHALREREGIEASLAFAAGVAEEDLRHACRRCRPTAACGAPAPPPSSARCQNAGDDNSAGRRCPSTRTRAKNAASPLGGRTNGATVASHSTKPRLATPASRLNRFSRSVGIAQRRVERERQRPLVEVRQDSWR